MKSAEDRLQAACIKWFDMQYPRLKPLLFAIPNGGARSVVTGSILKATGVRPGVADLCLLYKGDPLFIEMKTPQGRQSTNQNLWQLATEEQGFKYVVCRSLQQFIEAVQSHIYRASVEACER